MNSDQTLYLICEELKSRRLLCALQKIGIDECAFLPNLYSLILKNLGLDAGTDEVLLAYNEIMQKRCKKIEPCHDSILRQATKAYRDLKNAKRGKKLSRLK